MPLTLNLLHEEQKQLQARQRDPLKLGMLALVGVALLFMGYYAYRLIGSNTLTSQLHARQAEWARQEPLSRAALAQETELNLTLGAATAVTRRIEERFYWAPLLGTVQRIVPAGVQILSLSGSNDLTTEKVVIGVEGIAAGAEPRAAAEQFRIALADALSKRFTGTVASFRSLEEATATVALAGKTLPTAKFSIDITLKKSAAVPTPAPEPARPPAK